MPALRGLGMPKPRRSGAQIPKPHPSNGRTSRDVGHQKLQLVKSHNHHANINESINITFIILTFQCKYSDEQLVPDLRGDRLGGQP